MPKLDGSENHPEFLTPFDAHDQVLRNSLDYQHQEYPKAVAHDEMGEPIIAQDAAHEAELLGVQPADEGKE